MKLSIAFVYVLSLSLCSCSGPGQTNPVTTGPPQYQLVPDWPQLPSGYVLGNPSGIGIDNKKNIVVFHRASKNWPVLFPFSKTVIPENTVLILDHITGKIIAEWGSGLFVMPHSLTVDKDDNIWVTDVGLQQILKFDHRGRLLLRIGTLRVAGCDSLHFDRPTDVAVAEDGSFYVSDGYRNTRVVKLSASGKYLFSWGSKGDGPGQFDLPHGLDLDDKGNVYVADRENSRIQVFDANGKFLRVWNDKSFGKLYSIRVDRIKKYLVCTDYVTNYISPKGSDILVFGLDGKLIARFGRSGNYSGPVCRYHDCIMDDEGNIYVGDILENRLQKFQRIAAGR
jgi:peptidylamidoglycolate lyase